MPFHLKLFVPIYLLYSILLITRKWSGQGGQGGFGAGAETAIQVFNSCFSAHQKAKTEIKNQRKTKVQVIAVMLDQSNEGKRQI